MTTQSQDSFLCVFPLTPCMGRKLLDVCSSLHQGTQCIMMMSYQVSELSVLPFYSPPQIKNVLYILYKSV